MNVDNLHKTFIEKFDYLLNTYARHLAYKNQFKSIKNLYLSKFV